MSRRIPRGVKIILPNRYHPLHYADASARNIPARHRSLGIYLMALMATPRSRVLFWEPLLYPGLATRNESRRTPRRHASTGAGEIVCALTGNSTPGDRKGTDHASLSQQAVGPYTLGANCVTGGRFHNDRPAETHHLCRLRITKPRRLFRQYSGYHPIHVHLRPEQ